MMRTTLATALVLTALTAGAAFADDCQTDVAKLDEALARQDLAADVKQEAEDLRNNAVQLCGAGNTDEGLAVTAEAKSLLNVE
jgi:hypothetical protein